MVDLFGKKKQEDRISKLEEEILMLEKERDGLKLTIDKRDEKMKKLASSYQEAVTALKAAELKAASSAQQLQGEEEKEERDTGPKALRMAPEDAEKMLRKLSSLRSKDEDLLTAYLATDISASERTMPPEAKRLLSSIRLESAKPDREIVLLHCPRIFTLAIVPPIPIDLSSIDSPIREEGAFFLDPLFEAMETPVLLISAHAGDTFLAVALSKDGFEAEELVRTQVKEKHSKGGWSQKRFERLREEDIRNHAESVIERLSHLEEKYGAVLKYAVLSGDQALLKQIAPKANLPVVEKRIDRHEGGQTREILENLYQFSIYRSCGEQDERLG